MPSEVEAMKYRNIKTNGYASRRESKRATEWAMLQRAGFTPGEPSRDGGVLRVVARG